jgi:uncharacterized membrane protein YfcA
LTGVGSVFAVPLLAYVLGLPPHQAVCVSMVSVSACGMLASILKCSAGEIEIRAGGIMAAGGVAGAPVGAWIGGFLSGEGLMLIFAAFIAAIAMRLLLGKAEPKMSSSRIPTNSRSARAMLSVAGLFVGIVAGLLGVGGVLIAPSLVLLARLPIHRAIATTLPVIFIISISAISSHFLGGQRVPPTTTALFAGAGATGMIAGMRVGDWLSGQRLQVVFAGAMLAVAAFIVARSFS